MRSLGVRAADRYADLGHDTGDIDRDDAGDHGDECLVDRRRHGIGKLDGELGLDELDVDHRAHEAEDQRGEQAGGAGEGAGDHARPRDLHRDRAVGCRDREPRVLERIDRTGRDSGQGVGEHRREVHGRDDRGERDHAARDGVDVIGLGQVVAEGDREAQAQDGDRTVVHVDIHVDELRERGRDAVTLAPPGVGQVAEEHVQQRRHRTSHGDGHDGDEAVADGDEMALVTDLLGNGHELGFHPVHESLHG